MKTFLLVIVFAAIARADSFTDFQQQQYNDDVLKEMKTSNEIARESTDILEQSAQDARYDSNYRQLAAMAQTTRQNNADCYFTRTHESENAPLLVMQTEEGPVPLYVQVCNGKTVTGK